MPLQKIERAANRIAWEPLGIENIGLENMQPIAWLDVNGRKEIRRGV